MFAPLLTMTREDSRVNSRGRASSSGNSAVTKMDGVGRDEIIHSGHFMVSDIDDPVLDDDDEDDVQPVSSAAGANDGGISGSLAGDAGNDVGAAGGISGLGGSVRAAALLDNRSGGGVGYDFERANQQTSNTYNFGPRSSKSVAIDASLTKLFQCMTLAYRGKLTSPRWKNFKGLKIRWKDKIRLNNIIWRAWHMQFVKKERRVVCEFQCPLDSDTHCKPEAVVLEGKYWKRQIETIRAEYKSWRLFTQKFSKESIFRRSLDQREYDATYDRQPQSNQSAYSSSMIVDDDLFSDFNDTLLSCLIPNQPFAFPNPREIARAGIADFIQPGLVPFQPNLDDCMDTFDWFSDIFSVRLPPVVEEESGSTLADLLGQQSSGNSQNGSDFAGLNFFGGRTASLSLGSGEQQRPPSQQQQQQQASCNDYQQRSQHQQSATKNVFSVGDLGLAQPDLSLFGGGGGGGIDNNIFATEPLLDEPGMAMDIGGTTPKMESPLTVQNRHPTLGASTKIQHLQQQQQHQQSLQQHEQQLRDNQQQLQHHQGPPSMGPPIHRSSLSHSVPPPIMTSSNHFGLHGQRSMGPYLSAPVAPPPTQHQQQQQRLLQQQQQHQQNATSHQRQPPRPQRSSLPTLLPGGARPPGTPSPEHHRQHHRSPLHNISAPTSPSSISTASGGPPSPGSASVAPPRKYVEILPDLPHVRRHTFQAYPSLSGNGVQSNSGGKNLVDILCSPSSVRHTVAIMTGPPPPTPPPMPPPLPPPHSPAHLQQQQQRNALVSQQSDCYVTAMTGPSVGQPRRSSIGLDQGHRKYGGGKKTDEHFALPKGKGRTRSRSGPNLGQSLRASPPSVMGATPSPQQQPTSPMHAAPAAACSPAPTTTTTTSTAAVMPQSALLAQLLATGNYAAGNIHKAEATNKCSSPGVVPILPATSAPQTVTVITPVTFAAVTKVNDLQSRVLVGATSQVFGSLIPSSKMALSSSSSTLDSYSLSQTSPGSLTETLSSVSPNSTDMMSGSPTLAKPFRPKSDVERVQYKEHRRVCHINAEQKRRCNIKNGFETIHHLVPSLRQNPHGKISKAAMLLKAGEYIKQLKDERSQLMQESDALKKQITSLNQAINMCQSQLPATGAPIPCQRPNKMHKLFDDYVRSRTLENWKFWIFSILIRPLMDSYNSMVSTASMDDMCRTVLLWLEQHCSLVALRPGVFNSLRHLSTTTNILSDPLQIREEAVKAVRL